jgi:hypothetical protein
MRSTTRIARLLAGAALAAALASMSQAQTMRTEAVTVSTTGTVIEGEIRSDDTVDYLVAGEAGQTLSVDLAATNTEVGLGKVVRCKSRQGPRWAGCTPLRCMPRGSVSQIL